MGPAFQMLGPGGTASDKHSSSETRVIIYGRKKMYFSGTEGGGGGGAISCFLKVKSLFIIFFLFSFQK
jgi:hypothetical protein